MLAALPPERALSFCETSLFCLVTHLPFRKLMDVSGHQRLQAFCQVFGQRPGAQATEYRFDVAPGCSARRRRGPAPRCGYGWPGWQLAQGAQEVPVGDAGPR